MSKYWKIRVAAIQVEKTIRSLLNTGHIVYGYERYPWTHMDIFTKAKDYHELQSALPAGEQYSIREATEQEAKSGIQR